MIQFQTEQFTVIYYLSKTFFVLLLVSQCISFVVTQTTKIKEIREKFNKFWTKNQRKLGNLVSKSQWQPC